MPIIVNELVFKGTIADASASDKASRSSEPQPKIDVKSLVETCVEEVVRVLEREKER